MEAGRKPLTAELLVDVYQVGPGKLQAYYCRWRGANVKGHNTTDTLPTTMNNTEIAQCSTIWLWGEGESGQMESEIMSMRVGTHPCHLYLDWH